MEVVAGVAAIVAAAGCVFAPVVGSAVDVVALKVAVLVHSPAFVAGADDPGPVWTGVSGAHWIVAFRVFVVAAGISGPVWRCRCLDWRHVRLATGPWRELWGSREWAR